IAANGSGKSIGTCGTSTPQDRLRRSWREKLLRDFIEVVVDDFRSGAGQPVRCKSHLLVEGSRTALKVNGETTLDAMLSTEGKGRTLSGGAFAVQSHDPGSVVYFRSLRVKPLE
ncbi:MAG: hypothetical protein WCL32_25125, partial [Planctomycetota bacterium]